MVLIKQAGKFQLQATYGFDSCIMENKIYALPRLAIGSVLKVWALHLISARNWLLFFNWNLKKNSNISVLPSLKKIFSTYFCTELNWTEQ